MLRKRKEFANLYPFCFIRYSCKAILKYSFPLPPAKVKKKSKTKATCSHVYVNLSQPDCYFIFSHPFPTSNRVALPIFFCSVMLRMKRRNLSKAFNGFGRNIPLSNHIYCVHKRKYFLVFLLFFFWKLFLLLFHIQVISVKCFMLIRKLMCRNVHLEKQETENISKCFYFVYELIWAILYVKKKTWNNFKIERKKIILQETSYISMGYYPIENKNF